MAKPIDRNLAWYVVRYFPNLMNAHEREVWNQLGHTLKATGRSDLAAQEEAKKSRVHSRVLSNDPEVMQRAAEGWDAFVAKTAERILAEQGDQVFLNRCARCGTPARTPTARQCWSCRYDWHGESGPGDSTGSR